MSEYKWKRLESSTVAKDWSAGLEARIADPLWMLARQWQVGEFHGEDAARPVFIQAEIDHLPVRRLKLGALDREPVEVDLTRNKQPLETLVEREIVREGPARVRISAEAGLQLMRMLEARGLNGARQRLRAEFPLEAADAADLDPIGDRQLKLLMRGALSGRQLYARLSPPETDDEKLGGRLGFTGKHAKYAGEVTRQWLALYPDLFREPLPDTPHSSGARANQSATSAPSAPGIPVSWSAERLEYTCALATPDFDGGVVLNAAEYPGGRLEWYDFNLQSTPAVEADAVLAAAEKAGGWLDRATFDRLTTSSKPSAPWLRLSPELLASPVRFAGMPASRWWEFEDNTIYFGDVDGGPEDLARAVVAAFALTFGDDWFQVPVRLPFGAIARVRWVAVTDNFGRVSVLRSTAENDEKALKEAAAGKTAQPRTWRFFELSDARAAASTASQSGTSAASSGPPWFYLPDVSPLVLEDKPLEEVILVRDEAANLGWAIEAAVESAAGRRVDRRLRSAQRSEETARTGETWRYRLMTDVPEHFVPLVPVRIQRQNASTATGDAPGVNGSMRLQRGRMPVPDGEAGSITRGAVGYILEPWRRLLIHEEEVPGSGISVTRSFQMTRTSDGGVHLWIGRRKRPAQPQSDSGLAFDEVVP